MKKFCQSKRVALLYRVYSKDPRVRMQSPLPELVECSEVRRLQHEDQVEVSHKPLQLLKRVLGPLEL